MRRLRSLFALVLLALAAAPMSGAAQQVVSTDAIAKLEANRTKKPNDPKALRALGIAYFKNKRYGDAQGALAAAAKLDPKDGVIALYLGMSAEEQNDLTAAREAYTTYVARGKTRGAKDDVSKKLAALSHREMQARARTAVANERQLATQTLPANVVAVMPLTVVTSDSTLRPLGRGIAALLISDLAKAGANAITLVERENIQAIADELRLNQTVAVDRATAARSGRLVQAGKIVTGTITAPNRQATATLSGGHVLVATTEYRAADAIPPGGLNALFDAEKSLAIGLLRSMGIQSSPEVMAAIQGNRPTQNIDAFLAYSRGLAASDGGRLDEAAQFFDNARALDPRFSAATAAAASARAGAAGQGVTTAQIDSRVRGGSEGQVVTSAERGGAAGVGDALGTTLENALADVNPSTADVVGRTVTSASSRDASTQTTGNDQATTRTGVLTIVIKRP